MRRTEQLQGLRLMKFEDVYGRCYRGDLSQAEPSTVKLKAALRQIDPDDVNLFHGRLLLRGLVTPPPWHTAMPSGGGVHSINFPRLTTVLAMDENLPCRGVQQAFDVPHQCGLSGSGEPHHTEDFTLPDSEVVICDPDDALSCSSTSASPALLKNARNVPLVLNQYVGTPGGLDADDQ